MRHGNPFSKLLLCLFVLACSLGLWILLRFSPGCEEGKRIAIGEAAGQL